VFYSKGTPDFASMKAGTARADRSGFLQTSAGRRPRGARIGVKFLF